VRRIAEKGAANICIFANATAARNKGYDALNRSVSARESSRNVVTVCVGERVDGVGLEKLP
jgi:hypothetical protein